MSFKWKKNWFAENVLQVVMRSSNVKENRRHNERLKNETCQIAVGHNRAYYSCWLRQIELHRDAKTWCKRRRKPTVKTFNSTAVDILGHVAYEGQAFA